MPAAEKADQVFLSILALGALADAAVRQPDRLLVQFLGYVGRGSVKPPHSVWKISFSTLGGRGSVSR
ncbi:hypothetical protein LG322_06715 [Microbacterium aerolatum]|uniref:hypothetical protein n=1 Tax=Microbacterium aerolatum TaxID=153731 RepID=UPI0038514AFC